MKNILFVLALATMIIIRSAPQQKRQAKIPNVDKLRKFGLL
jgi:hypothetical protein